MQLALKGFTTRPGAYFGVVASAALPEGGAAKSSGRVSMKPVQFEMDVALDGLDLTVAQPYVGHFLPFEILSGKAGSKGKVTGGMNGKKGLSAKFAGDLEARTLALRETVTGSTPLKWDAVQVRGVEAGYGPLAVADQVDRRAWRGNRPGDLGERRAQPFRGQERRLGGRRSRRRRRAGNPIPIRVDSVVLSGCSVALTDHRLQPPYTLTVEGIQGTVKGISSPAKAPAHVDIAAAVRGGGAVTLKGAIDLFQIGRATDLQVGVQKVEIPPLSPMSVHYLGYPVTRGHTDIALDYKIKDHDLKGANHIVTQDLTLGDKVEGQGKVSLPIKLGVSLLTDKAGRITLDFPVEGRLDDPNFGIGTALGGVVSGLIKSPFRLLSKGGGGKGGKEGEDLGYVEFQAGSAALDPASIERLRDLADALKARPGFRVVVAGAWDESADGTALEEASQPIPAGGLESLGRERADAVRATLVDAAGLDASRVELAAPRAVTGTTGGRVRLTFELVGAAEAAEPSEAAGTAS